MANKSLILLIATKLGVRALFAAATLVTPTEKTFQVLSVAGVKVKDVALPRASGRHQGRGGHCLGREAPGVDGRAGDSCCSSGGGDGMTRSRGYQRHLAYNPQLLAGGHRRVLRRV